ncbi:RTA1 like protein-domain-containing protein [Aspergillus welwitschiae]|uniref:RTA1 like protein-domain-containing protein n=1 Tax=Aspergillus welwitschiae TaxID=1341132 RepID=A0A3F3Q0K6_9EURO|nr:RTA1 like protein-domain-containing protein [Aspergillus welwitschiae]RDH32557.1 RTA1 like protein-domain-containing protein [Aspergillus welwitschiae]
MPSEYRLYEYTPSTAAAITATTCFGLITICHLIHYFAQRTWFFTPFIIGGIFETAGYTARIINSEQAPLQWTTAPYIMQELLLLLAPSLFAASIYMVLGRIVRVSKGESQSPISARWITRVFVIGDVLAILGQATGGGILSQTSFSSTTSDSKSNKSRQKLGNWIIIGGLIAQIIFFGLFILVSGVFDARMTRSPPPPRSRRRHRHRYRRRRYPPWRQLLRVLYVVDVLIIARCVFRVVEFAQGRAGVLQRKEVWMYVFDGLLMFLVMVVLLVWHPSRLGCEKREGRGNDVEGGKKKRRRRRSSSHRRVRGWVEGGGII